MAFEATKERSSRSSGSIGDKAQGGPRVSGTRAGGFDPRVSDRVLRCARGPRDPFHAGDAGKEWISMAHHKRGKRKNARAGCIMCKPHKANGNKNMRAHQLRQELRARVSEREQRREDCAR